MSICLLQQQLHGLTLVPAAMLAALGVMPLAGLVRAVATKSEAVVSRSFSRLRGRWLFRGQEIGTGVYCDGRLCLDAKGRVRLGNRIWFTSHVVSSHIVVHPTGTLEVGNDVVFNYGLSLEVTQSVVIGNRCMFGSYVRICDKDSIGAGPVVLEDDVWVAHGAVIQPGVRIGAGSVVSAGAVVTQDIPPESLAVGNPARAMSRALRTGPSQP